MLFNAKSIFMQIVLFQKIQFRISIGLVGRVFANGPGDLDSIPGRVIPKTLKMILDTSVLNTEQYKVRIKGKVEQSRERSSASPTPRRSSYRKGRLLVVLDYGHQLYKFSYSLIVKNISISSYLV